jgi:hypothetical protein
LGGKMDNEDVGEVILEFIQFFVDNGGYSNFEFDEQVLVSWNILMLRTITEAFIKNYKNEDKLILNIKKNMKETYTSIKDATYSDEKKGQMLFGGRVTVSKTETEYESIKLEKSFVGNKNTNFYSDICVLAIPVGLFFRHDTDELVNIAVKMSKLTHNNTIGILGGITAAYFVSLAINGVDIMKWVFMLIDLLESRVIKDQLELEDTENMIRYTDFLRSWQRYRDTKFNEGRINQSRTNSSLVFRWKKYMSYSYVKMLYFGDIISCLIVSYDCLLDCGGQYEKMIYYGFLLPNKNDIGAFAGALYGLIYGTKDIPKNMISFLESKGVLSKIKKLSDKLN